MNISREIITSAVRNIYRSNRIFLHTTGICHSEDNVDDVSKIPEHNRSLDKKGLG